ncbi:MAG: tetratricopeptide repeat protein [Anaerolineales bacterium]
MAGNRARFEKAKQRASDLVWDEQWSQAVEAYERALQEFPDDESVLMGYAWALFNSGDVDRAAEIYQRLTKLEPKNPVPYERLAEILIQRGKPQEAGEMYVQAASRYEAQGAQEKQVPLLEKAIRAQPENPRAWSSLLEYYQKEGLLNAAVRATEWLAYLYQQERPKVAIEICRQVQALVPHHRQLGQVLTLLQSNRPVPRPTSTGEPSVSLEEFLAADQLTTDLEDVGTPTDIARQRALESLAESIFEERPQAPGISQEEVNLLIGKAVDAQTRGDLEEAISAYEQLLDANVDMASMHFNLGLLYKEQMRFEEAIEELEQARLDSEYVLASHYALGECYQAKAEFNEALGHFLEAVKIIDLATVERTQVDDLIRVYEGLAQSLINTGEPERVQSLASSLVGFLNQRGWEDEVTKARQRLDDLARSGTVLSLAEIISLPEAETIMRSVALAQEYTRREKPYSALEELTYAVSRTPFYLPLHSMLGNLRMDLGQLDAALDTYRIIARTYEIRGQVPQALTTYSQILELSPLDVAVHRRVIDIYIRRGQIDDALQQHLQLADAYYQMAQLDRARESYAEAMRLAPRGSPEPNWEVRLLHRMADLDMQRLDWKAAIKDYEHITRVAPDDERAHLGLMRLYPRTGRVHLGLQALDRLLKRYLSTKRVEKALAVLIDLVQEEPDSIPLRYRAAQLCLNVGRREEALEHLDVLGDLQLEAGKKADALKTIEAIIALKPPSAEAYTSLYKELSGREPPA